MAYTPPPRFAHGDEPTAAQLNTLSENQVYLSGVLGGIQPAVPYVGGEALAMVRVWRWLHYWTTDEATAQIGDPSGVNESASLPDSDGAWAVYDLAQVDWLSQGQNYTVTGVDYVAEDFGA